MSDKIARLGIERDNDLMYYIKNGDVWATPRKQKGQPKGKAKKIAETGLELDYSRYIYFLDGDGDVARKARALGGGRRAKPSKSPKPSKAKPSTAVAAPSAPRRTGKKSEAELDRDIEECLAQARTKSGNGNSGGNGTKNSNGNGNGTKSTGKRGGKKKKRR